MFKYFIPTKILFGRGQLERLHKQALPGKKALIVISSGKSRNHLNHIIHRNSHGNWAVFHSISIHYKY